MENTGGPSLRGTPHGDLNPLPDHHRHGLTAVTVLACMSFVSALSVLTYLTVKLVAWQIATKRREASREPAESRADSSYYLEESIVLGLPERDYAGGTRPGHQLPSNWTTHRRDMDAAVTASTETAARAMTTNKKKHPNQVFILLHSLFVADALQSAAFLLNGVWVGKNAILIHTPTCFAQGWLVSTGDLASSLFITALAVHAYLDVVREWKPPQWALYATVGGLWFFDYFLALLGLAVTLNGRKAGGFYVRASAWCWMNAEYDELRLVLHYLYIFASLIITSVVYSLIFFHLRRRAPRQKPLQQVQATTSSSGTPMMTPKLGVSSGSDARHATGTTPKRGNLTQENAFLLYPIIYVFCTAPLAIGRIASMSGVTVPISYFCAAGALTCSNGLLDVLLWSWSRQQLLFSADVDTEDTGLSTFVFMRTPNNREFGNMVWVQGASNAAPSGGGGSDMGRARGGNSSDGGGSAPGPGAKYGGAWLDRVMKHIDGWRGHGGYGTGAASARDLNTGSRGGIMRWQSLKNSRGGGGGAGGGGSRAMYGLKMASEETLTVRWSGTASGSGKADGDGGMAIKMDLVTSVVVETGGKGAMGTGGKEEGGGDENRGSARRGWEEELGWGLKAQ